MNPAGQEYTLERLRQRLREPGSQVPLDALGRSIVEDVCRHLATGAQTDDMCLVLLRHRSAEGG